MKKELFSNVFSLIWNLFIIYVCYSLCRLTFLLENFRLFSENLTGEYALNMFGAGIIFDTTAILYSNALFILLFLLPFHWKENATFCPLDFYGSQWLFPDIESGRLCVFPFFRTAYYHECLSGI